MKALRLRTALPALLPLLLLGGHPGGCFGAPAAEETASRRPAPGAIRVSPARIQSGAQAESAFDAYQAGDLANADLAYRALLGQEPRHRAALLGLATIALRQERFAAADAYYRRAIEADPQDIWAQAGLLNLNARSQPLLAESRLKSLSQHQPDNFLVHFALGNLYATSARWSEAQHAYRRAIGSDPDNPDAIFNLAVVLDHLRRTKLAADYYRQALAAAEKRPAATNKAAILARLAEIGAGTAP